MVEYGILGPLAARVDGHSVDLGGARTRAVLAVLLLGRNTVGSTDRLVDAVWGEDPPPTAETALQNHVSRLRRLLGADAIETRAPGYVLRTDVGNVDVERFEALVERARAAGPREAGLLLREALGLWRPDRRKPRQIPIGSLVGQPLLAAAAIAGEKRSAGFA